MHGKLVAYDGTEYEGVSFGAPTSVAGEVVFTTGMTGYPESLTDPSYAGQILVLTYPLVGNYGVPEKTKWESGRIHASALIVSSYNPTPSHYASTQSLSSWLKAEGVPGLEIKDTRALAQKIRTQGTMLGKVIVGKNGIALRDPNKENLVAKVSTKKIISKGKGERTCVLIDCGAKRNIERELLARGFRVTTVPWDCDIFKEKIPCDYLVVSNGPGDPKMCRETVAVIEKAMRKKIPILGICLGNQLLALAAGGDTYKLKFGHRGQNHPVKMEGTEKCFLTTQNHGFAITKAPRVQRMV